MKSNIVKLTVQNLTELERFLLKIFFKEAAFNEF